MTTYTKTRLTKNINPQDFVNKAMERYKIESENMPM